VLGFLTDEQAMLAHSRSQGRITHGHPLSDQANLALAKMTAALLLGQGMDPVRQIAEDLFAEEPKFSLNKYRGSATGYVVDTVQTVLYHFMTHESFESCVIAVVNRGDDADTTGALAGMLAGARFGVQSIPRRWMRKLDPDIRHRIEVQVRQLLALHSNIGGRH
jgi:ADP-ribosyl-[dinitrogen reductase] hydrolase